MCFQGYVFHVLEQVRRLPSVGGESTVAFVAENKGGVSEWLEPAYSSAGSENTMELKAGLDIVGKDARRRPLEAADLLCWYLQRFHGKILDGIGRQRFDKIRRRRGVYKELTERHLMEIVKRFKSHRMIS